TVTGPYKATGSGDTPSRRRIFSCHPTTRAQEDPCAKQIIARLARLAYRGDATDVDLQRMLASPKFRLHIEQDPAGLGPAAVYRLGDRELASRLSFFLWSSMPDTQ